MLLFLLMFIDVAVVVCGVAAIVVVGDVGVVDVMFKSISLHRLGQQTKESVLG